MKSKSRKQKSALLPLVAVVIVVLVLGGVNYWLYRMSQQPEISQETDTPKQVQQKALKPTPTNTPIPTPTPTPARLPGTGKQPFSISSSGNGIHVTGGTLDPIDPAKNQKQTVEVKANYTSPIDSISIKLITDNKSQTFPMKLTSGTGQSGSWTATLTTDDTYLYTYIFEITATSGSQKDVTTLTIRKKP